jgi:long-chain acyl-CoA synthetase
VNAGSRDALGGLLLTGASGFVGQSVLARWLATGRPATVLLRAEDDDAAQDRVVEVLERLLGPGGARRAPVRALAADLTGMDAADLAARVLAGGMPVEQIIHSAACVRFDQELDDARAVNVRGTARMLELAQRLHAHAPLQRYVQVSTAYVAGCHRGRFGEADRWIGQDFRNTYEQSKLEAEQLVTANAGELPVQIVRPSIVVGDTKSGWTAAFNVLYVPLRALVAGAVQSVPQQHDAGLLDVVPVDYVADGILGLAQAPADGRTYHLTAGRHALTVGDLADLTCDVTGRPAPPRVPSERWVADLGASPSGRVLLAHLSEYLPYLDVHTRFDASHAEGFLRPQGISVTPLRDYLHHLIAFAQERRWGRSREPLRLATPVVPAA